MSMQALMSLGTELLAVVFGQHVYLTLMLMIFLLGLFEGQVYISNGQTKKKNIFVEKL
jgi:hypothetical protein